jgi:phenazine biosynthesis protein phzE
MTLVDQILVNQPPPFALLYRPDRAGKDRMDVLVGSVSTPDSLAAIPLADGPIGPGHEVLVVVPYRQIAERGFACVDDRAPLLAMRVTEQAVLRKSDVLDRIEGTQIVLVDGHFDVSDEEYADTVGRIIADEIAGGQGANFVINRSYVGDIPGYHLGKALTFFRRLCERETGAYWTFIVHTGTRTFVGATPERHISVHDGVAVMNPISGTYRYPPTGPTLSGVLEFLNDRKESDELHMVVDEELKMMAKVCESGGRVAGPYLKEMARLAHTEYFIEGRTDLDPREILAETMFAPTVTGSPLESACRVIRRYEPKGRGYYSGVLAVIGRDQRGTRSLDSAILIRTADVDRIGRVRIGVGATLVRHSDPRSEVAETRAKVAGLLSALEPGSVPLSERSEVLAMLGKHNTGLAEFWLASGTAQETPLPALTGRKVLVVDAEDAFTAMIAHQLRSLGLAVTVRRFDDEYTMDGQDLVVMGPGPGDPRDADHPRIAHLYGAIGELLAQRRPFLAVCLSHQVLSRTLGLELDRCAVPNQGTRREIDLFGKRELVGFYNSFAARSPHDRIDQVGIGTLEISRDAETGEVHALRGPRFASMQFHAESVLTEDGPRIFATRINEVLGHGSEHSTNGHRDRVLRSAG